MTEALQQAQSDPDLARWLAGERAFDSAIATHVQRAEPPSHLRARLLAGARASSSSTERRMFGWWLAAAAAAVVLATSSAVWWAAQRDHGNPPAQVHRPLLAWQQSCLAIFADPNFALDMMDPSYAVIESYLVQHGTRVAGALPFVPGAVEPLGCKVLAWENNAVSFACFRATTGELVHLFVVPRGTADESLVRNGPHRTAVGEFSTVTWLRDDLVVLVASKMAAGQLEGLIAHPIAQRARAAGRLEVAEKFFRIQRG